MKKFLFILLSLILTISVFVGGFFALKKFVPKAYNYIVDTFKDAKEYLDLKKENKDNNNYDNTEEILLSFVCEIPTENGHGWSSDIQVKFENHNIYTTDIGAKFKYKDEEYVLKAVYSENIGVFELLLTTDFYNDITEDTYIKVTKV